jgi:hypothetical protein
MSQSLAIDKTRVSLPAIGAWVASNPNYLGVRHRNAGLAGCAPFREQSDWSIHCGSIKPGVCG